MALRQHSKYTSSPGYVLEWTSQTCHRHVLSSVEELRSEVLAGDCPGLDRLLVLPSPLDDTTTETLRAILGVDAGFLEAHAEAKAYRPKGRPRGRGVRAWCWKFPAANRHTGATAIYSASLWVASEIPILLIHHLQAEQELPKLRHKDAATRRSTLQSSGPYGALGQSRPHKSHKSEKTNGLLRSLEDDLREALDGGGGVSTSVDEILGELVHERWVKFVGSMRLGEDPGDTILWEAMTALEQSLDEARYVARQGRELEAASLSAWEDIVQRLHLRIQLRTSSRPKALSAPLSSQPQDDVNERSLDRIAYLGGVLLPVTVVAGVLSIEGEYGPEGDNFWVFWVASAVATLVALLVIYLDQLRSLEVWLEDGNVFNLMGEEEDREDDDDDKYLVQRQRNGSRTKAWRRSKLGWSGAVKKASGYYKWRGNPGMEFERPRLVAVVDEMEVV